tara:strand:+ start:220 stop:489 length:270 start_codon:yes stop_codon:yes gene_type:complete
VVVVPVMMSVTMCSKYHRMTVMMMPNSHIVTNTIALVVRWNDNPFATVGTAQLQDLLRGHILSNSVALFNDSGVGFGRSTKEKSRKENS